MPHPSTTVKIDETEENPPSETTPAGYVITEQIVKRRWPAGETLVTLRGGIERVEPLGGAGVTDGFDQGFVQGAFG